MASKILFAIVFLFILVKYAVQMQMETPTKGTPMGINGTMDMKCSDIKCYRGRDGRDGGDGRDGRDGRDCVECAKGPKGDKGVPGKLGEKGDRGEQGKEGKAGPKGNLGPKGEAGPHGDKGVQGKQGEKGDGGASGPKGEAGICDEKRLKSLVSEIKSSFENEIKSLKKEIEKLKSETVKIDSTKKIPHALLPAGFSEVRVADLQLESLHAAAAAACRGSTRSGGSGCCRNVVYPRSKGLSCTQVCKNTAYTNCDAEVSIRGRGILARSSKDMVGNFYNYGCNTNVPYSVFETDLKDSDTIPWSGYISYCCCRK